MKKKKPIKKGFKIDKKKMRKNLNAVKKNLAPIHDIGMGYVQSVNDALGGFPEPQKHHKSNKNKKEKSILDQENAVSRYL